ncbi:hypothetical protein CAT7_07513 [Carnobacterium sp. AT7]|uniref:hypothetical protein n=1 Tax=Carnobacterium sp. AT7 TaxID=333990 RepID=UPI00015F1151|nr:hypothetical protein [Carnobacterium sp. AT7]EDP68432.1 hypothetical protein CAT7_07513 [Carnobacterium sp. AT7]
MNKRIKQKVAKRIINKIGTEKLLTDFERKYFIKFFWKPLRKEVTRIVEELKIEELSVIEETAVEQAEWLGGIDFAEGPDMTVHSVKEPTEVERFQNAINDMNNFGSQLNPESPAPVEEPGKWNKLKVKVKGWFGK